MWISQTMEITKDGKPTGKFRMTATSDEDGGGPFGNDECFHDSEKEAQDCKECIKFCEGYTGHFPTKEEVGLNLVEQAIRNYARGKDPVDTSLLQQFVEKNK